jgi:hypothetical protein
MKIFNKTGCTNDGEHLITDRVGVIIDKKNTPAKQMG